MSSKPLSVEERLVELECRYAELEDMVGQLNAVVTEQASTIEAMARQIRKLKSVVETVAERQETASPLAAEIGSDADMTGLMGGDAWDAPSSG